MPPMPRGLILSSDSARVVAPLGSEFSHIRAALNDAEATYKPTDYLDALQTADEILASIPIGEKTDLRDCGYAKTRMGELH